MSQGEAEGDRGEEMEDTLFGKEVPLKLCVKCHKSKPFSCFHFMLR